MSDDTMTMSTDFADALAQAAARMARMNVVATNAWLCGVCTALGLGLRGAARRIEVHVDEPEPGAERMRAWDKSTDTYLPSAIVFRLAPEDGDKMTFRVQMVTVGPDGKTEGANQCKA